MKKFTSIICALMIVLGVNAVPQAKAEKVVSFAKAEKVEKKAKKAGVKVQKVDVAKFAEAKKAAKGFKQVRKAKLAATNVAVSKFSFYYSEEYGDVFYLLYDEIGENAFAFDILVSEGDEDVKVGQTYTLEDMDADYSTWGDPTWVSYGYGTAYTSASFKKSMDENGKIKIEASVTDEDGEEFNLLFDESTLPELPAGGTFVADEVSSTFYEEDNDVYYVLPISSIGVSFNLDIYVADGAKDVESGKTYTLADMLTDYSNIETAARKIAFKSVSFTKTVASDGSYTVAVVIVDENDNIWNISASKAAPTVIKETLTLNGIGQAGSSTSQIEAANADSTVLVSLILYSDQLAGTYTEEDLLTYWSISYVLFDGVEYDIEAANFTVVYDSEAENYKVSGTLDCVDPDDELNKAVFTLDLTIEAAAETPVDPGEEGSTTRIELSMKNMQVAQAEAYWDLKGEDPTGAYYLEIRSKSADVDGDYTEANLDDYWTYIGTGEQVFYDLFKAKVTVALADGLLTVKGEMTFVLASSNDTIIATLDVAGIADGKEHLDYDASDADYIVDFPNPTINLSYIADYGVIIVKADNDDLTTIYLEFNVDKSATGLAAGEYTVNSSAAVGTVTAGAGLDEDSYLTGSYAGKKNASGYITTPFWWIVTGTVTVGENGVITVDAVNTYDKKIQSVIGTEQTQGIQNTKAAVNATKRLENGMLIIEKNGKTFNVNGAIVK